MRRVQKSTATEDKDRAMQIALGFEAASRQASRGALTRREVLEILDRICRTAGQGAIIGETSRSYLQRQMESRAKTVSPRTARLYRAILADLTKVWGERIDRPIGTIDRRDVMDWRDSMIKAGNAPTTVNARLSTIGSMFAEAVRDGYTQGNPFEGASIKGAKAKAQERKPFSLAQVNALIESLAAEKEWQAFVTVAAFTGQRQQEVAQLVREQVDLENEVIRFQNSKARSSKNRWISVPMHPRVKACLAPFVETAEGERAKIFPVISVNRERGRNSISSRFREVILPRIGIEQPYATKDGKKRARKVAQYSFHSLRHFYLSLLDSMGVTEAQRMQLVGHADRNVTIGYTHPDFEKMREIVGKIPG